MYILVQLSWIFDENTAIFIEDANQKWYDEWKHNAIEWSNFNRPGQICIALNYEKINHYIFQQKNWTKVTR